MANDARGAGSIRRSVRIAVENFSAGQLDEFFGIGQSIVLPEPGRWTWLAMEQGVLTTDSANR